MTALATAWPGWALRYHPPPHFLQSQKCCGLRFGREVREGGRGNFNPYSLPSQKEILDSRIGRTFVLLLQINLQKLWVTLGSIMVSLTFVFGNNMRSIYEAVVYLFVVHPYDVGDAVLVGPQQDWCTVIHTPYTPPPFPVCLSPTVIKTLQHME